MVEKNEEVCSRFKMEPELVIIDVWDNSNVPLQYTDNNYNNVNFSSSNDGIDSVSEINYLGTIEPNKMNGKEKRKQNALQCDNNFHNNSNTINNDNNNNRNNNKNPRKSKPTGKKSFENPPQTEFSCYKCKKAFNTAYLCKRHSQNCNRNQCIKCNRIMHLCKCKQPIIMPIQFSCYVCKKMYATAQTCKRHIISCIQENAGICGKCNKRFCKCKPTPKCKCKLCSKEFSKYSEFENHLKKEHTNKNAYEKITPGARTMSKIKAEINDGSTTDVAKMFKCKLCKKLFPDIDAFNKHYRTHTGEQPFKCDICKIRFSRSSNLFSHLKMHYARKEHTCKLCNLSFYKLFDLRRHIEVHLGNQKEYRCLICGKKYSRCDTLKRHNLNYHTNI